MTLFTQCTVIFTDVRSPREEELITCQHIATKSSKTWDPHKINFPKHAPVTEDIQFLVKTSTTTQRVCSVNTMGPRTDSAAKLIDTEYSVFAMPTVKLVELRLCGIKHDVASVSKRLAQTKKNIIQSS